MGKEVLVLDGRKSLPAEKELSCEAQGRTQQVPWGCHGRVSEALEGLPASEARCHC